jgi:P4 family phage/plasmid primase-like protien
MLPYLKSRSAGKEKQHTHTRIGDKSAGIHGGKYAIPESEKESFMNLYYQNTIVEKKLEYLTERQLLKGGPILIDVDLRYDAEVSTKQHTEEHIIDAIGAYADVCNDLLDIPKDTEFDVFVMEKSDVNRLKDKTKDGIHIIIGLAMDKPVQELLRKRVLPQLQDMWGDLPITNTWDDVIDDAVTKGCANWQMYGSRKPGHQAYVLTNCYRFSLQGTYEKRDFDLKSEFQLLSARYTEHPCFEVKPEIKKELQESPPPPKRSSNATYKLKIVQPVTLPSFDKIRSNEELDQHIKRWFDLLEGEDYKCRDLYVDTHKYTMSLPPSYFGPGSMTKWIRVGWALANTHPNLFLTWVKFSAQDGCRHTLRGNNGTFDWNMVDDLWTQWQTFEFNDPTGLTHRSIMYWCKNDAPDAYNAIKDESIEHYIMDTIIRPSDVGLARVLHQLFKDKYICASIKNNIWFEYDGNRWHEIDSGNTIRLMISNGMGTLYFERLIKDQKIFAELEKDDPKYKEMEKANHVLADICHFTKTTQWKNNIMREAKELFWDQNFVDKLDQNPHLLCFTNGVVDFSTKKFRKGQPDDCVSKCTNIQYDPLDKKHADIKLEIETFFEQLFPENDLRKYMWEHLASVLVGTNENQTFNIYTGTGANGKSIMVELMSKCLGSYKATVPITLITQNRPSIGNTSSEVVQLMGTRYAVMQEPSKGDKINEGIMKEITGGDPLQARALFKDTVTFTPQFKLVVCTNTLFDIQSNDDGTWRRIRVCDFKSKFIEEPYADVMRFPKEDYPYQYPVDKNIKRRFKAWAPVLMSMLVEKAFETGGLVEDQDCVKASSDLYREGQNYVCEFINEKVERKMDSTIKKGEISEEFVNWYKVNRGGKVPQVKEVFDYMESQFGKYKRGGWANVSMIYDE